MWQLCNTYHAHLLGISPDVNTSIHFNHFFCHFLAVSEARPNFKTQPNFKTPWSPLFHKSVTEESHMASFLPCSGNCPGGEFSCPSPTHGNLNNKAGLKGSWNSSGWSKCCSCFISQETPKLPRNEVRGAKQAASWTLELQRTLLQTTALQCQSHRPRAGSASRWNPLSLSTRQRSHIRDLGQNSSQVPECRAGLPSLLTLAF